MLYQPITHFRQFYRLRNFPTDTLNTKSKYSLPFISNNSFDSQLHFNDSNIDKQSHPLKPYSGDN